MASLFRISDDPRNDGPVGRQVSTVFKSIPGGGLSAEVRRAASPVSEVLLLAGGVRPKGFRAQLGRSVLDLPVSRTRRLLDLWCEEIGRLSEHFGWGRLRARVLIDGVTPAPKLHLGDTRDCDLVIARDLGAYRGTGGVLRDACRGDGHDGYVLVCHACQLLCEPLSYLVERLLGCEADLSFPVEPWGGAGGVFLVRARCLSAISDVGFVDFKEQAIPVIARRHSVRMAQLSGAAGLPIRSLHDYIEVVRQYHVWQGGDVVDGFSIVEPGARVEASSRVHDSVVLAGGRVEAGAVLAGSLVTAAGVVGRGRRVVHGLVTGPR